MKKTLFVVLFSLLFISCSGGGRNGTTAGNTMITNDIQTVDIENVDFSRPKNSDVNWFFSQYQKRISMWLREGNVAEFYIDISKNETFKNYIAEFSNDSVCSFLNVDGILFLNEGRNTVLIKGNTEGCTILKIYGVNEPDGKILISGFDNIESKISNRELEISVYPKDYAEYVNENIIEYGDIVGITEDNLSIYNTSNGKIVFPKVFSLDTDVSGYLSYRGNRRVSQGICNSCSYFSAVGLLEIETKRHLIEKKDFQFSKYNIDLSEKELLDKRNRGDVGANVYDNLQDMSEKGWIIPLEKYNPYVISNCIWSNQNAVDHFSGAKILKNKAYMIANKHVVDFDKDKIETRVKSLLYFYHRAVSVALDWPEKWGRNSNIIEGDETYNGRHAVNIIGWNDNHIENGVDYGKVWIAQNSHLNRQIFYIKMGNIANPSSYTYIGEVVINGYDSFVSDIAVDWQDNISRIISKRSNRGDYIGHELLGEMNLKVLRNPKEAMPDIPNVPSITSMKVLPNVELYKVNFRVNRDPKGLNYRPYFPKSVGIAAISDNPFLRYCEITKEDDSYVYFTTYVVHYKDGVVLANGTKVENSYWAPCKPEEAVVGYIYELENN